MSEWEFIAVMCDRTGCGQLLDVNNIFVSARNHGFAPDDYLAGIPFHRVVQFHVAGHSDEGTHIVDTYDGPVIEPVWDLLAKAWPRAGGVPVLLEWDAKIPSFIEVEGTALRARTVPPQLKTVHPRTRAHAHAHAHAHVSAVPHECGPRQTPALALRRHRYGRRRTKAAPRAWWCNGSGGAWPNGVSQNSNFSRSV